MVCRDAVPATEPSTDDGSEARRYVCAPFRGCSSMVEPLPSKQEVPVRSRSPAPRMPPSRCAGQAAQRLLRASGRPTRQLAEMPSLPARAPAAPRIVPSCDRATVPSTVVEELAVHVTVHVCTRRSRAHDVNQDRAVVGRDVVASAPEVRRSELPPPVVVAVLDGLGGHAAGEVASDLAAQMISDGDLAFLVGRRPRAPPTGCRRRDRSSATRAVAAASAGPRARRCGPGRARCRAPRGPGTPGRRHDVGVLAHPGGEHQRVEPAEHRGVGADVLADPVAVHVEGEPRVRRPPRGPPAVGARCAGRCRRRGPSAAPPVEQRLDLVGSIPPSRIRWKITAGSMSPDRVPITSPSSGERPIEVSTLRPPSMAVADAPLPRWRVISLSSSIGRPRCSAARRDVGVRGAVEAVPAHPVVTVQLVGTA
jgi:hypothetical protein